MSDKEPETIDVMLGDVGGQPINTLMLERTDVIVPLERDLDADPFQDDEVCMCTLEGTVVQRCYFTDDEVEEDADNRVVLYRFSNLRYGVYSIRTKIGGQVAEVYRGLVVCRDGVFMGDQELATAREGAALAPEPDHAAHDGDDDADEDDNDLAAGADDDDADESGDEADNDDDEVHPSDRQVDQDDEDGEGHGA